MKIVTLLPAATEIICDLGLSQNLFGISHECDYPLQVKEKLELHLVLYQKVQVKTK